jgi:hypothetical protein
LRQCGWGVGYREVQGQVQGQDMQVQVRAQAAVMFDSLGTVRQMALAVNMTKFNSRGCTRCTLYLYI